MRFQIGYWDMIIDICSAEFNSARPNDAYELVYYAIIVSDNGSSRVRCLSKIWTNDALILMEQFNTNSIKILIQIQTFSSKETHLRKAVCKMAAILYRTQYGKVATN